MLVKENWNVGIVLSIVVLFCALAWLAFTSEKVINDGRLHVQKPVAFPDDTPRLKKHVLVFFGYVGCATACTPRMQEITSLYKELAQKGQSDHLSVLFINLQSTMSTQEADTYAKSFHPEFIGVTYDKQKLLTTLRMFQAYYSHSLLDSQEIEHTQFLYSVYQDTSSNFYLNNIYMHIPYDKEMIVNDLIKEFE